MNHHAQLIQVLRSHFGWKPFSGIEIGTSNGDSAKAMLGAIENLKLLATIDPWTHLDGVEFEASFPQERLDESQRIARECLSEHIDNGRCNIFAETSDQAVKHFEKESVDFVWIDGHHEYEQVGRDIWNYAKFVKVGGIVGGHDYGQVPDVTRAVNEIFGEENISTGGDFTWWIVKV